MSHTAQKGHKSMTDQHETRAIRFKLLVWYRVTTQEQTKMEGKCTRGDLPQSYAP